MEKLTLAVLSHLPTAVLYVHDLSGECGTSPSDQVFCGLYVLLNPMILERVSYMDWSFTA